MSWNSYHIIHVLKMQSGTELEMKIAWVLALAPVSALSFGSYSQDGKFPSSDLTRSQLSCVK